METKTRALIIDDDAKSVTKLTELLSDYHDINVVSHASTLKAGRRAIEKIDPDILFLDIELPDGNGLELLEDIKDSVYVIVFTGYYEDYAENAFAGKESDYLLKPINNNELDKVIQRYRHATTGMRTRIPEGIPLGITLGSMFTAATCTNEMRIVRSEEIGYFRYSAKRKVWEAALVDKTFVQLKKGTSAQDILSYNDKFVQTHQSYIVNLGYMMMIGATKCKLYPPFSEDPILVGRRFSKDLKKRFTLI